MKCDNYIFDLYGTLVDIHTEEEKREVWEKLALFFGYYDARFAPEELQQRYQQLVSERERTAGNADVHEAHPEIRIEEVFEALFREKGVLADRTLAIHAGQFFRILSTEYLRLYPGTIPMLSSLREAGKKVYLLSNAQRIFTEYELHMLGIAGYFDDIFISSECGVKKPDPRFFQMLLEKHGLDVSKSIMIGNDLQCDMEGAKGVGLSTFYIHSNISPALPQRKIVDETGRSVFADIQPDADYVLLKMDMEAVKEMLEKLF